MNPEYKKYILENIDKKPIAKIAQELNIKERKIKKFLEKEGVREEKVEREAEKPRKKWLVLISVAVIAIIGFAIYANSLNGTFIWDDEILVIHNHYIKDLSNIPGFFTKPITYGSPDKSNFYRPLQTLTLAFNYAIGKLNPQVYHLTNIIFHVAAALMLYWLAYLLSRNRVLSLIAAVFFVCNPMHTEAVTYISGRADPMVLFFMILTVILYIQYSEIKNKRLFYLASVLSFVLALLCKEVALITPFLVIAYDMTNREKRKMPLFNYIPFLAITVVYIILRKTIFDFDVKRSVILDTTIFQRLPIVFGALAVYLRKLALPIDLHMEYQLVVPRVTDIWVIIGIGLVLIFIILPFIAHKKKEKVIVFSIAWFIISYIPISNIYPLNAFFAEHWIYAPSVGLFLLIGWVSCRIWEKGWIPKVILMLVLIPLVAFYSYLTIRQNETWREPKSFYERILLYNPTSARVYYRLSLYYFERDMIDEGIPYVKKAIEILPTYADALTNLANAYVMKGRYDMAIVEGEKAVKYAPDSDLAHLNLGAAYFKMGRNDDAIREFARVVSLNPNHSVAHFNLAIAYYNRGEYRLAITHYDRAAKLGNVDTTGFGELLKPHR